MPPIPLWSLGREKSDRTLAPLTAPRVNRFKRVWPANEPVGHELERRARMMEGWDEAPLEARGRRLGVRSRSVVAR